MTPEEFARLIAGVRFDLSTEAALQAQLEDYLTSKGIAFNREYVLDARNRLDFFIDGLAVETKVGGGAMQIYRQCARYCSFDAVKSLVLLTNRAMGLPPEIGGKKTLLLSLGRAWL